ncbi:MAG: MFS transporter [Mangrovicoccus sp.]|nr:MFS transporter [Mangrovicoccus sp.]
MSDGSRRRQIWGWYFFDWASQPYNTLLITFIFGPYISGLLGDGTAAQAAWGYGLGAAGMVVAVFAPLLGSIADRTGPHVRMRFIGLFSVLYVIGSWALWYTAPGDFNLPLTLAFFGLGLIGMEMATIFTNAILPELGGRDEIGRLSGRGWAFGNLGGFVALVLTLLFLAESGQSGRTLIGLAPVFGLDPATREGTRAVGPFTAIWYILFMLPFFAWIPAPRPASAMPLGQAARLALPDLKDAVRDLRGRPSLSAFLLSSMFYRDALNGLYTFGGIYAAGVLGWSVVEVGIFGIVAVIAATVASWFGAEWDARHGAKPVIVVSVLLLCAVTLATITISPTSAFGIATSEGSPIPNIAFFVMGALIGATGSTLQASSRSLMVVQANPRRITQGFGLYALTGKATAFLAPFAVALATDLSGTQQLGILPIVGLFLAGLVLLVWVRAEGDTPR